MNGFKPLPLISMITFAVIASTQSFSTATGYFQLHNLMSAAQKNVPSNLIYNDAKLNLQLREKDTGHVVNTQFANDGGVAGCGISNTLMQYMYKNSGTTDLSKNYLALNVYSQIMGFDPQAPFWGNPEGQLKGYLTQGSSPNNIAYPYTPYHRVIPSIYPAYLGLYNNGLNCGRWMEINYDAQSCNDRTTPSGISKYCANPAKLNYANFKMQGYIFDSCEDNNGWCRDDAAHIDVNGSAFNQPANYFLQWKFIRNPYYADVGAPNTLKDVWLAWFGQASKYWSYIAILNAENGIGNMQYNVGDLNSPTWINSHVLAGDNNITWSSTSNNGQLWQIEPVNALVDAQPANNPLYQMRMFDYLGYPAKNGTIYQFHLLFDDDSLGQEVSGYSFFYQGGGRVKPGAQLQNMSLINPPTGTGTLTVLFNQLLPNNVSLDTTKSNYLRPVLLSENGFTYDPEQCTANQCVYSKLPTNVSYKLFAHAFQDVSNDLTLRKINDVSINSSSFDFPINSTAINYSLKLTDLNLSTQYSARVQIPLKFTTTAIGAINSNLQAIFVPNNTQNSAKNISAQTQACFLNNYMNKMTATVPPFAEYFGNNSTCTLYYTVNHQTSFPSSGVPVSAGFNVILPNQVGVDTVNYKLAAIYNKSFQVAGYNPQTNSTPNTVSLPMATYNAAAGNDRSLYLILDPQSDSACLENLDPVAGVGVTIGSINATLTKPDVPVEVYLNQAATSLITNVHLSGGNNSLSCQAMPAIVPNNSAPLKPGIDVIEVIKLVTNPVAVPPPPAKQGIAATAIGDTACLGGKDTLTFNTDGNVAATVPYTVSATSTDVGVQVAPGTYRITDTTFNVGGGTCQLSTPVAAIITANTYTPVNLHYQFTKSPSASCTATVKVLSSWPTGCTVQMTVNSQSPLSNVTLYWLKGNYDWTHAQVWGGQGSLSIPIHPTENVSWPLPAWVNGQNSSVGMNVNGDVSPSICSAFSTNAIEVTCSGIMPTKKNKPVIKKR